MDGVHYDAGLKADLHVGRPLVRDAGRVARLGLRVSADGPLITTSWSPRSKTRPGSGTSLFVPSTQTSIRGILRRSATRKPRYSACSSPYHECLLPASRFSPPISSQGRFELKLEEIRLPPPAADEIVVHMEARAHQSCRSARDVGPVDKSSLVADGTPENPILRGQVPESRLASVAARWDRPIFLGNEGAWNGRGCGRRRERTVATQSRPPRRNL